LVLGSGWQREIHRMMGMDPPARTSVVAVLLVAALLFVALVALGRALRRLARWLGRRLGRWIPPRVARPVAAVAVAALAIGVLNGVVIDGLFAAADSSFKTVNGETDPGIEPPTDPGRSGGPGSVVSWASLGNQGRKFVAGGPTAEQLADFGGPSPERPIRVYTGIESAPSAAERAELAVRELERTGAFSREVLCVIGTTGTGWVDESAVDPLEYMYHGDTALVAMQYSYLPSWISFLVDKERAREAGRELFNHVYAAWAARPEGQRPKLVVFGESLGSFGAESAFSGSADMAARTDGMLLVGPPNRNTLWREYVADRESGTPEILPTYDDGGTVRFGARSVDLDEPDGVWGPTRVVYLQHPSDPITWWTPRLMLNRPDWLEEPRGADVSDNVRWYPFVTFWQITADMAFSTGVPDGHGHSYGAEPVQAWSRIIPPDGWTDAQAEELTRIIQSG
ncbi:MAG TPA: alpha/beta hydrolase, partial [Micromonosporaceae bacterium]|nr:alpha/beta hydrolase [Micromonosporaceae bacterium]